jgi:hypothetical protein
MNTPEQIKDGGPAFPCESYGLKNGKETTVPAQGMSLRDWFAGQALQAIISKHPPIKQVMIGVNELDMQTALGAYDYADAMLKARGVKP